MADEQDDDDDQHHHFANTSCDSGRLRLLLRLRFHIIVVLLE